MLHREGQTYKIKVEQEQPGLPKEVTLSKFDSSNGSATLSSSDGNYESTIEILETFYDLKEDFNLMNMPKLTVAALDELVDLFDVYASTSSPLAGIQVKSKVLALKENIAKAAGIKEEGKITVLGKKIS